MTSGTTDYESWQHADLVRRVHDLEQKLLAHNNALRESSMSVTTGSFKKPRKAPKPFDPSKYSTRKIALKFAYLGANYNGLEHHANNATPQPTIEEELWKALKKTRLIFPQHKSDQSGDEVCWDGCEYSKCGRTDKGVSAFGQVVVLKVRSARPLPRTVAPSHENGDAGSEQTAVEGIVEPSFDSVKDELPYIQLLNRVLPPEIRVLAWCADLPPDFNARFSCRERRYRYFFTNPAYLPFPAGDNTADGWLNIDAMKAAAKKYEGLHDFRNFCKIDPSKQITNFERRIFHAGVHAVGNDVDSTINIAESPKLYFFEVRGSAFLWHQVRHLVALLFLVGQGYESADLVDELLDVKQTPSKPVYDMASDVPLVLWDCIFPDLSKQDRSDHSTAEAHFDGYDDVLPWIYAGDEAGGRDPKRPLDSGDGKYGNGGIMEDLWSTWRQRKLDEVLAQQLQAVVATQGQGSHDNRPRQSSVQRSARVFDGGHEPRNVGPYTPIMQRARMEAAEVLNARYAARKGLEERSQSAADSIGE